MSRLPTHARLRRMRPWNVAVAVSGALLALVALALTLGWLVSERARSGATAFGGSVNAIDLRLPDGSAEIVGGGSTAIRIARVERSAFGHGPSERRSVAGGVLRLASECPRIVIGSCTAAYRVVVPDGVTVSVTTGGGDVRLTDFRGSAHVATGSGSITAAAFCGFDFTARSRSGTVDVIAACAPKLLDLRSTAGDVSALVPPGRYRVQAGSERGRQRVSGVSATPSAAFSIDAHSQSGDVAVEGGL